MMRFGGLFLLISIASATTLGGWQVKSTNDNEAKKVAMSFVQDQNVKSNSLFMLMFMKLTSVKVQIVAGKRYNLTFEVGESSCMKNKPIEDLGACHVNKVQECNTVIWVNPFGESKVENSHCVPKPEKLEESADLLSYKAFKDFQRKYNKNYSTKEEIVRYKVFKENMKVVSLLNSHEDGSATYGATEFADMTKEEFAKTHLSPKWEVKFDPDAEIAEIPKTTLPKAWDWRDHNAVSAVKNQGSCGSCWAFSTTGNIEGQWAIKRGKLLSLSEQELVDCDKVDDGCNGGLPSNAYKEIERLGGLETEKDYPYEGEDEKCSFKKKEAAVDINGYMNISSNEDDMAAWLAENGPISIGINANAMQFYFGGVSHPWSIFCDPDNLDHGVLIVGYGVEKGFISDKPYWIIKNSWGSSWGEQGYYRVYKGAGVCGLNKMPTSAIVNPK